MRARIERLVDSLNENRQEIKALMELIRDYGDDRGLVGDRVDLGHADHEINRAISFVNRLLVNGKRPWDEEVNA